MSRKRRDDNNDELCPIKCSRPFLPFVELDKSIILYHLWPFLSCTCALALVRVCNDVKNRFFYQMPKRFPLSLSDERLYDTNFSSEFTYDLTDDDSNYKFNTLLRIPRSYDNTMNHQFKDIDGDTYTWYDFEFDKNEIYDTHFHDKLPLDKLTWCYPLRFCGSISMFNENSDKLRETRYHWIKQNLVANELIKKWITSGVLFSIETLVLEAKFCVTIISSLIDSIYVSQIKALHIIGNEDIVLGSFIERFVNLEILETENLFEGKMTIPPMLHTLIFNTVPARLVTNLKNHHSLKTFVFKSHGKINCDFLPSSITSLVVYSDFFPNNISQLNNLTELSMLCWKGQDVGENHFSNFPCSLTSLSLPSLNNAYLPPNIPSSIKLLHLPNYEGQISKQSIQHPITIIVKKRHAGRSRQNMIVKLAPIQQRKNVIVNFSPHTLTHLIENPQYIKYYLVFRCNAKVLVRFARFLKENYYDLNITRYILVEFLRHEQKSLGNKK